MTRKGSIKSTVTRGSARAQKPRWLPGKPAARPEEWVSPALGLTNPLRRPGSGSPASPLTTVRVNVSGDCHKYKTPGWRWNDSRKALFFFFTYLLFNFKRVCVIICGNIVHDRYSPSAPDIKSQLIRKDPDAGKDWRQEEKGIKENNMVGWHHRLNGREFE